MQWGAVGLKSYLMVVEIHDAAVLPTLTSPVVAKQLAVGPFFFMKMATQDLTIPLAANQVAVGALFYENDHPGFNKPCGLSDA